MSTRCPGCGADTDYDQGHDTQLCIGFQEDVKQAVNEARRLGLPTDKAARLVGLIGTEVPAPYRLPAVWGALAEWCAHSNSNVALDGES